MSNVNPARLGALVQQLSIAQQQLATAVNRVLGPMGLNMSQLSVLAHFTQNPQQSLSVTGLAVDMQLNQPTMTKIVQHLVRLECLEYAVDEGDARRKRLTLTSHGMKMLQQAYESLIPMLGELFTGFIDTEIDAFFRLIAKLNQRLHIRF